MGVTMIRFGNSSQFSINVHHIETKTKRCLGRLSLSVKNIEYGIDVTEPIGVFYISTGSWLRALSNSSDDELDKSLFEMSCKSTFDRIDDYIPSENLPDDPNMLPDDCDEYFRYRFYDNGLFLDSVIVQLVPYQGDVKILLSEDRVNVSCFYLPKIEVINTITCFRSWFEEVAKQYF